MESKHFAIIVGARPNFIKAAPLLVKFHNEGVKYTLIHTGQHSSNDMSDVFFDDLGLPRPDVRLEGDMYADLREYFTNHTFDGVIVFGDVDSTLAGAVSAFSKGLKVFHVEAGLRSWDDRMPEEKNRKVVDHLSSLHFVSEPSAIDNLLKEGILYESILPVGNLMIESLEMFKHDIDASNILFDEALTPKKYVVATIHRKENTNAMRLKHLLKILAKLSREVKVVFPIHPRTKALIDAYGYTHLLEEINCLGPLGYFDFLKLVKESKGVITDSGGVQEETTHLGIPCVTLRMSTERPITTSVGSNMVLPEGEEDVDVILSHLNRVFEGNCVPMWDNKVSQRIYENLRHYPYY